MSRAYPLVFQPIFKQRIWGGRNLERLFGKELPPGEKIGESWELADLESDESLVALGPAAGTGLGGLVRQWGRDLLGSADLFEGRFPLLIKFLDAEQTLSVQVHPDEQAARTLGAAVRPKHEAWFVVDARPDAAIYCGLKPGVTKEDLAKAARDGTVGEMLNRFEAKAGDCFYLPAGTVHALGAGLVVAEVQTPSDVTYRLFDWNRIDPGTGKPRELHLAPAVECARLELTSEQFRQAPAERPSGYGRVIRLVRCDAFVIDKVTAGKGLEASVERGEMAVWIILAGRGRLRAGGDLSVPFKAGDTLLLPAALGDAALETHSDCTWLQVTVPARR